MAVKARIEGIRLQAGPMMRLGDVAKASVPKMVLIPRRVHAGIGVFAAASVATACTLPGSPAHDLARLPSDGRFAVERPTGAAEVFLDIHRSGEVRAAGTIRTARKLMEGRVFPARYGPASSSR